MEEEEHRSPEDSLLLRESLLNVLDQNTLNQIHESLKGMKITQSENLEKLLLQIQKISDSNPWRDQLHKRKEKIFQIEKTIQSIIEEISFRKAHKYYQEQVELRRKKNIWIVGYDEMEEIQILLFFLRESKIEDIPQKITLIHATQHRNYYFTPAIDNNNIYYLFEKMFKEDIVFFFSSKPFEEVNIIYLRQLKQRSSEFYLVRSQSQHLSIQQINASEDQSIQYIIQFACNSKILWVSCKQQWEYRCNKEFKQCLQGS